MIEGIKNDRLDEKLMWELLPIEPIEKIVEILTYGALKYAPDNWKHVEPFNDRYYAALMRHIVEWRKGVLYDRDTGKSHLAHAACNLIFLLSREIENEDKK